MPLDLQNHSKHLFLIDHHCSTSQKWLATSKTVRNGYSSYRVCLLLTAYVVREEAIFSVCLSVHIGGHPLPGEGGAPRLGEGAPPCWGEGVPPCGEGAAGGRGAPCQGPPHRSNMACTCYAAVGMPLAFTQEDFLDAIKFSEPSQIRTVRWIDMRCSNY